jgi:hypothetical protein
MTSEVGKKLFSILLGLGLSTTFRMACKGKNCVVYSSPEFNKEILDKVYSYEGKCYKYAPEHVKCDPSKKILTHRDTSL